MLDTGGKHGHDPKLHTKPSQTSQIEPRTYFSEEHLDSVCVCVPLNHDTCSETAWVHKFMPQSLALILGFPKVSALFAKAYFGALQGVNICLENGMGHQVSVRVEAPQAARAV